MRRLLLIFAALLAAPVCLAQRATPPGQPEEGPGSTDYAYDQVRVTSYGEGAQQYWVFEPVDDDGEPPEAALPVVGFLHGLNAMDPAYMRGWIDHLVRKGGIVLYPRYQGGGLEKPSEYTPASADALRGALTRLDGEQHALGDPERFAYVGHSLGGTIIANLASNREAYGLPTPKALMSVLPGDTRAPRGLGALLPSLVEDMSGLPGDMLMLVVASEDDQIVGDGMARRIFAAAEGINEDDKDYLVMVGDDHGSPALVADHFIVGCPYSADGELLADALDFKLWALFDALMSAAFNDGQDRGHALGNTDAQRSMGAWSDGTPVKELVVGP